MLHLHMSALIIEHQLQAVLLLKQVGIDNLIVMLTHQSFIIHTIVMRDSRRKAKSLFLLHWKTKIRLADNEVTKKTLAYEKKVRKKRLLPIIDSFVIYSSTVCFFFIISACGVLVLIFNFFPPLEKKCGLGKGVRGK